MGGGVLGANLTWEESSAGIEILSQVKQWAPLVAFLHAVCWDPPHVSRGCWSGCWSSFPVFGHLPHCPIMCRSIRLGRCLRRAKFVPDGGRPCMVPSASSSRERERTSGAAGTGQRGVWGTEKLPAVAGVLCELRASSSKVWGNFSSRSLHLAETLRLPSLLVGYTCVLPQNQTK